ncbi:hypothetical protein J6590_001075 [Homalodisca vitripennis]|nr:hypothetical protein J6590_001075 [Homalodisca vitripennis]
MKSFSSLLSPSSLTTQSPTRSLYFVKNITAYLSKTKVRSQKGDRALRAFGSQKGQRQKSDLQNVVLWQGDADVIVYILPSTSCPKRKFAASTHELLSLRDESKSKQKIRKYLKSVSSKNKFPLTRNSKAFWPSRSNVSQKGDRALRAFGSQNGNRSLCNKAFSSGQSILQNGITGIPNFAMLMSSENRTKTGPNANWVISDCPIFNTLSRRQGFLTKRSVTL